MHLQPKVHFSRVLGPCKEWVIVVSMNYAYNYLHTMQCNGGGMHSCLSPNIEYVKIRASSYPYGVWGLHSSLTPTGYGDSAVLC